MPLRIDGGNYTLRQPVMQRRAAPPPPIPRSVVRPTYRPPPRPVRRAARSRDRTLEDVIRQQLLLQMMNRYVVSPRMHEVLPWGHPAELGVSPRDLVFAPASLGGIAASTPAAVSATGVPSLSLLQRLFGLQSVNLLGGGGGGHMME
jgi:hypothetical protein